MAGIRQKEQEVQKLVLRKVLGRRLKGAGAKEVAAVAGTRQLEDGTAARAGMQAMVGGKCVPESAVPDLGMYIRV